MESHWVYRLYGEGGVLLYVGYSQNIPTRMTVHASEKPWWSAVEEMTSQRFPTRREALEYERATILAEKPTHNIARYETVGGKTPIRGVRVPDELWEAAQQKARDEERTVSDVVRQALENYVEVGS